LLEDLFIEFGVVIVFVLAVDESFKEEIIIIILPFGFE
jgi:hypothetical protein